MNNRNRHTGQLGPESAGQSGDTQGLNPDEDVNDESVTELAEEGQALEAGVISGVEDADRNATREVTTHEMPEDDIPLEYRDRDN